MMIYALQNHLCVFKVTTSAIKQISSSVKKWRPSPFVAPLVCFILNRFERQMKRGLPNIHALAYADLLGIT